jgi:hypothetical protein
LAGLCSTRAALAVEPAATPAAAADAVPASVPFTTGEKLTYELSVMGAKAGVGVLTVGKQGEHRGAKTLAVTGTMKSEEFFDNMYRVRDKMATLLSFSGKLHPVRAEYHSVRNDVERKTAIEFDPKTKRVKASRKRTEGGKTTDKPFSGRAPAHTHDVLSWIYYLRTVDYTPGHKFSFNSHSGNFLYQSQCEVLPHDKVWTRMGHMETVPIRMVVRRVGDKEFKKEAIVWFSADAERLPVRISFEFQLGKGEAILTDVERTDVAKAVEP